MKNKKLVISIVMLLIFPLVSTTITANSGAELEFELRGWLNKTLIVTSKFGALIKNTGEDPADRLVVEVWISGGIFGKLRPHLDRLGSDYWAYGISKLQSNEEIWCPLGGLNLLYLGNIDLTVTVSANNAEPVTHNLKVIVGVVFLLVVSS